MTESVRTTTRERLLDAAADAFAEEGFEAASLRRVMRSAGVDPGAIHYHFGDRRRLVAGLLDDVLGPLNARRLELLASLGGVPPVRQVVEALVRPDCEAAAGLEGRSRGRGRLLGAIYVHPADFVLGRVESHFAPVAAAFLPVLKAAVPDVPVDVLSWRVRWVVFGAVGALLIDDSTERLEVEALLDRLIPPLTAALAAPTTRR